MSEHEIHEPRYIVGIDLGTTHSVVAYTRAELGEDETPDVRLLEIAQVVAPGEVKAQPLLPSFLFMPGPHDVPAGALGLPWNPDIAYAVGEFARNRGAELPARLVGSAKSWLSHRGVDRTEPILPWDAPAPCCTGSDTCAACGGADAGVADFYAERGEAA